MLVSTRILAAFVFFAACGRTRPPADGGSKQSVSVHQMAFTQAHAEAVARFDAGKELGDLSIYLVESHLHSAHGVWHVEFLLRPGLKGVGASYLVAVRTGEVVAREFTQ